MILPPVTFEQKSTFESNMERNEHEDNKLADPDAFDYDEDVKNKVIESLESLGIEIFDNYNVVDANITENDESKFDFIKVRHAKLDKPAEVKGSLFISCAQLDIDELIFDTIQENGLVYNGRLIVKSNFQTTDPNIFACGKIVEFSQRHKNFTLGRSLRLDKYSGRELGQKLAKSITEYLGIMSPIHPDDPNYEHLPTFQMPIGICGYLPNDLIYIRASNVLEGLPHELLKIDQNRNWLVSDNLKKNKGQYLKFFFDNNGLIKGITYLGTDSVSIPSLVSLIGLSETYLNKLIERFGCGLVENVTEFLSENWAMALYHEWFSEFRYNLKLKMIDNENISKMMNDVTEEVIKVDGFLTRETYKNKSEEISDDIKQIIRNDALQFIKDNMNHLPMYYVPGTEFK